MRPEPSPRLIDLNIPWLRQYAPETTLFDPATSAEIPRRLVQVDDYLGTTWAAVLAIGRSPSDWSRQLDHWAALGELITRVEAEFAGRLFYGPDDHARWLADPRGLTWGLIGVAGFDSLIREPADLDRLAGLFRRGVRLFQPVQGEASLLGGSSAVGDDRGLTELGLAFLLTLAGLAPAGDGPRPLLDVAHLSATAAAEVVAWFEADADRPRRLIPVVTDGGSTPEILRRLRALGGVIGISPPNYESPARLKAEIDALIAIPFAGHSAPEGIAIATHFLGTDATLPGLANAPEVVAWLRSTFEPTTATALIQGNARRLLAQATGALADPA